MTQPSLPTARVAVVNVYTDRRRLGRVAARSPVLLTLRFDDGTVMMFRLPSGSGANSDRAWRLEGTLPPAPRVRRLPEGPRPKALPRTPMGLECEGRTQTLTAWATEIGISKGHLSIRLRRGDELAEIAREYRARLILAPALRRDAFDGESDFIAGSGFEAGE